jgi:hypothetical protein
VRLFLDRFGLRRFLLAFLLDDFAAVDLEDELSENVVTLAVVR